MAIRLYTPFRMVTTTGAARLLLFFSLVPIAVALVWYFQRARVHRALRSIGVEVA